MAGEVAQHLSPTSLQQPEGGNSASSQRRAHECTDCATRCERQPYHSVQASVPLPGGLGPGPCPMPMPNAHARGQEVASRCFGRERHANHRRPPIHKQAARRPPFRLTPGRKTTRSKKHEQEARARSKWQPSHPIWTLHMRGSDWPPLCKRQPLAAPRPRADSSILSCLVPGTHD
jgi:hypothetical protein